MTFADQAISECKHRFYHKPSTSKGQFISEIYRNRKPERSGANSKLGHAISFTRNLNEFAGEIQGTSKIQLVIKSEIKLAHYDRIRKAKSLLGAKHAKKIINK